MIHIKGLHQQWLQEPHYSTAYENRRGESERASLIIDARERAGLTQAALAVRLNTKQSLVARLESGKQNATIKTLKRIAEATGTHLKISFE